MQIANINYEKKYAYAEVEAIIDYLGTEYKNKVPKKVLRIIHDEKKIDYVPNFDFSKPLVEQVNRQETKNIIAYLYYNFWCNDEAKKMELLKKISINMANKKEYDKKEREETIRKKAKTPNAQSLDGALKSRLK